MGAGLELNKLRRHKDRWVDLCRFSSVFLKQSLISMIEKHLRALNKEREMAIPDGSRDKAALADREKQLQDKDIRKKLATAGELDSAIRDMEQGIREWKKHLEKMK